MKLAGIIESGMKKVNSQRAQQELGDRSTYIGASDLGQCPRKAVYEKVNGSESDVTTLIRFERGHLSENIVASALQAEGYNPERQVELEGETENGTPLKMHLDFAYRGAGRFAIMETKSTSPVPQVPYEGWEMQLHAQMGLAQENMPEDAVEGTLFALNLVPKDNCKPYEVWNGYQPSPELWESLKDEADSVYWAVQEYKESGNLPDDLTLRPGVLCSFCPCLTDCPCFQGEKLNEIAPQLTELLETQTQKKRLEKTEEQIKDQLKSVLRQKGCWVSVDVDDKEKKLRLKDKTSRKTDFDTLKDVLENQYGDSLENYKTISSYEQLEIK